MNLDPKICGTLVVHGLTGFGKSSLVNQVLQTKRFLSISNEAMFWINLGEHSDMTAIINPLWNLYLTAVKLTNRPILSHRPEDYTILQQEVKSLFLEEKLSNCFVILDDVKSSEVLNVFKLPCKIIVTTQDKNVAGPFQAIFIPVTTGFTQKESLELLRKSIETDYLDTKETYAKTIHGLCDGCPMLLNLIGSILNDSKEAALSTDIIWKSIITEIIENDSFKHPITDKVTNMIRRFVLLLTPEVQKCFQSLAVFPKHVNIRPEILMKLWDKSYDAVRRIMVTLEHKSLIVSFFNKDLKSYIYSIHSLVRAYLIETADANIKDYHQKLISKCYNLNINPTSDDPVANYIFGYYGYHAKNGELFEKFEDYFDLRFIEHKIKRVGSADLLTDFRIYGSYITEGLPHLERKLKDYVQFVKSYSSHLHISPETNIVQFAFFNDNNCVFEEAKKIAVENRDQTYFKLEAYSDRFKNFPVLKTRSGATCGLFLDPKEVLVGTSNGNIEIKSFHQYQHKSHRFDGHASKVFSVLLHPSGRSFLSISLDHSAKLWRFIEELDPQSPKLKQNNWKNLHSPDENTVPHKTFKLQEGTDFITTAAFPFDSSEEMVTGSKGGRITRWCLRSGVVIKEATLGLTIPHIFYGHDNEKIIFAYDGKVYIYTREHLSYNGQFGPFGDIKDLLRLPEMGEVAIVREKKVEIWDYVRRARKFEFDVVGKVSAATLNVDRLLVSTDSFIYLYNCTSKEILHYKNDYGASNSLLIHQDHISLLILHNEDVKLCEVPLKINDEKPTVLRPSLFTCHWKESLPIYLIVDRNLTRCDIFSGQSIISTLELKGVRCATFSLCGKYLILGTELGKVFFYNYKTQKLQEVMQCDDPVDLIKCFDVEGSHLGGGDGTTEWQQMMLSDDMSRGRGDGMVVIVSQHPDTREQGYMTMLWKGETHARISVFNKIVQVLYLKKHLVAIDAEGCFSITKIFDLQQSFSWTIGKYRNVVVATANKDKSLLAVVCKNDDYDSWVVRVLDLEQTLEGCLIFEKQLNLEPSCCCFSAPGSVLAVGCKEGTIKIFNIQEERECELSLHKRSVESLLFSSIYDSILVSIGDQIAWWNLESFNNPSEPSTNEIAVEPFIFTFDPPWAVKKLHDTVPYLLTSTNLHGKQLKYVSASIDFKSFLVIDVDGNIFKMDLINS